MNSRRDTGRSPNCANGSGILRHYNVADPFAKILNTDFAPLDERLRIFSRRLQNVPAYYAAAQRNLKSPTLEHTQLAIEQNQGALQVFEDELQRQHRGIEPIEQRASATRRNVRRLRRTAIQELRRGAAGACCPRFKAARATSFRLGSRTLRQEILLQHSDRRHRARLCMSGRSKKKTYCTRAWTCFRRSALAEILSERHRAERPAGEDRSTDRQAVRAACLARGFFQPRSKSRFRNSPNGSRSIGC